MSVNYPIIHLKDGNQSTEEINLSAYPSSPLQTPARSPTKQRISIFSQNRNQITPIDNNETDSTQNKRCLTEYCCILSLTCIFGWLLVLTVTMALAFILKEPHITTTITTTTTTSATTTTATTTTTVTADLCSSPTWNQTGLLVAGKASGTAGSTDDTFKNSACIYVDENYTIYVCDHHNERIQKWFQNATVGITIAGKTAGTTATAIGHVEYLTMDKQGYMYVAGHTLSRVIRFAPGSIVGTIAAGSINGQLHESSDVAVDENFNLYVADPKNKRIMMWTQNSTNGIAVITNNLLDGIYGILLAQNSSNQIYLSSKNNNAIYLWTFGAATPNVIFNVVNSTNENTLKSPLGMTFDNNNNLYVADKDNNRIVMFPANSTVGEPIVGECNALPLVTAPMDVTIDNNQDLYVVLDGNKVLKYKRG